MSDLPPENGRLLRGKATARAPPRIDGWVVGSRRFSNTAAKFWPRLIAEVRQAYPRATAFELSALGSGELEGDRLHPEHALEKELSRLETHALQTSLADAIAELDLLGPPAAVAVRVLQENRELYADALPLDILDADTWPDLLVWLLAWAGLPPSQWNREFVHGEFDAKVREGALRYHVVFDLRNRFIDRGFYYRELVAWARTP